MWATGLFFGEGSIGDGTDERDGTDYMPTEKHSFVWHWSDVTAIAAGNGYNMMLDKDGSVWATGKNDKGQLGDGYTRNSYGSVTDCDGRGGPADSSAVTAIAAGESHSMLLRKDGSVLTTGDNSYGQLGDGSNTHAQGKGTL